MVAPRRLTELRLRNFKAFERFSLTFQHKDAYLVGPNNAGKSTLLAATRSAAYMVRIAARSRAEDQQLVDGVSHYGHLFGGDDIALQEENLAHEFEQADSCLDVRFSPESCLTARWDIASGARGGFFFVEDNDVTLRQPRDVRPAFPAIGVVPVLAPLDAQEAPLSETHLRKNFDTRLASRHFRNQLRLLGSDYDAFREYLHDWTPELTLHEPQLRYADPAAIDVFYSEPGGRHPREIFWAGDGIHIWLQILLHLWRLRDADIVILDEPEVFLHPDLQRRLVNVLEEHAAQTIMATHSAEVIAEAPADAVLWVSRHKRHAVRAPTTSVGNDLSSALGTAFNLRLARALKARAVVFVEGDDIKLLRVLARTVGAIRLAKEGELATIALNGFERWDRVEPFRWLVHDLLDDLPTAVILDRDYRQEVEVAAVTAALAGVGVKAHVWARHELENYLLVPAAIARIAGLPTPEVEMLVQDCADELRPEALAGVIAALQTSGTCANPKTAALQGQRIVNALWSDPARRAALCPGKELRSRLNRRLQARGAPAVSDRSLARDIRTREIPQEMRDVLQTLDALGG